MENQKKMVLKHLEAGSCISGLEALKLFQIYRLSDVIYCLKRKPYFKDIGKEILTNLDNNKTYASYFLIKQEGS